MAFLQKLQIVILGMAILGLKGFLGSVHSFRWARSESCQEEKGITAAHSCKTKTQKDTYQTNTHTHTHTHFFRAAFCQGQTL